MVSESVLIAQTGKLIFYFLFLICIYFRQRIVRKWRLGISSTLFIFFLFGKIYSSKWRHCFHIVVLGTLKSIGLKEFIQEWNYSLVLISNLYWVSLLSLSHQFSSSLQLFAVWHNWSFGGAFTRPMIDQQSLRYECLLEVIIFINYQIFYYCYILLFSLICGYCQLFLYNLFVIYILCLQNTISCTLQCCRWVGGKVFCDVTEYYVFLLPQKT